MKREPVVSGTFYSSNSLELDRFIERAIPKNIKPNDVKGAILPHAGYIYSGRVAVETAANIRPRSLIIIMGPNHTGRGEPFSVYPKGKWRIPYGDIEIDSQTAKEITNKNILKEDIEAHLYEHSIEVELPILKYFFKEFKFIPIVCMTANITTYREIAQIIYKILEEKGNLNESLIIASSDMTHYEPHKEAVKKDKFVVEAISNLDTGLFLKRVEENDVSMCGIAPVGIMLEILRLMKAQKSNLIKYMTSGDVNNDYSSVVGYAGMIFQ